MTPYCRDEPALDASAIIDFNAANATTNLLQITGETGNDGTKKIMVPLKYLNNFWRTHEMVLIYCEIKLVLNWSKK